MGTAALGAGIAVVLLTVASQTGLLGGHDFATVALLGFLSGGFCTFIYVKSRYHAALGGLVLSLLPVALLVYYLATSDG